MYDAAGARFTRGYECAIKLFRAKDLADAFEQAASFRKLLFRMNAIDWVQDVDIWLQLKIGRNKLNHEYLPFDQESIYNFMIKQGNVQFLHLFNQSDMSSIVTE